MISHIRKVGMSSIVSFTAKMHMFAQYLLSPRLFLLRRKGGDARLFLALNKQWLLKQNFNTIIDIGANTGQFSLTINALFPHARIVAFEPLPQCFDMLQKNLAHIRDHVALNAALGDEVGNVDFESNDFSASSSFLKMTEKHIKAFPFTAKTSVVKVDVERLDNLAEKLLVVEPTLVKLDVQGYEDRVLSGGEQTIRRAAMIIVETSFEMLYENQPQFNDIYSRLLGWGFEYKGALEQFHDPIDGRLLQADSVFVRSL